MPMSIQQKAFVYLSWATLTAAGGLLFWVFWSLWWPFEPINVKPGSFEVLNHGKTVARGESLIVRMDYCKSSPLTAQMVSSIEQGNSLKILSAEYPAFPLGCHESAIALIAIPSTLALESTTGAGTGKAVLRIRLNYRVNALREITYQFVTDEFTITP